MITMMSAGQSKLSPSTLDPLTLPLYNGLAVTKDGLAILPVDFLPKPVKQLDEEWFFQTYQYFAFFDVNQRDENGNVRPASSLQTATPENMAKWKNSTTPKWYEEALETV